MTALEDRINNPKFIYWVKSSLLLSFAKDGITEYVETNNYNHFKSFKQLAESASSCCTFKMCLKCSQKECKNKEIHRELKQTHVLRNPSFGNTKPTYCTVQPWEYAKCFMPPKGYKDSHGAANTDLPGLISVILNDWAFRSLVNTRGINTFKEVKDIRNEIMHNATFEVGEAKFKEYIGSVIAMLNGIPSTGSKTKALSNIDELSRGSITITGEDIARVINEAVEALKMLTDDIKVTIPKMTDLANRCTQIGDKADEKFKSLEFKVKEGVLTIERTTRKGIGKLKEETRHGMNGIRREKEAADQTVNQKDGIDADFFENLQTQTENSRMFIRDSKSQSEHDKPIQTESTDAGVTILNEDVPRVYLEENEHIAPSKSRRISDRKRKSNDIQTVCTEVSMAI